MSQELRAYEPTFRDNLQDRLAQLLVWAGYPNNRGAQSKARDMTSLLDWAPGVGTGLGAADTKDAYGQGDYLGAGLSGAGVLASLIPGAGKAVKAATPEVKKAIRAYHGTPHDFDRFDLSKIGTGEGAQAYGHGLYFAENEGIARSYRDALSQKPADVVGNYVTFAARYGRPKGEGATTLGYLKSQGFPTDDETVALIDRAIAGATPGKAGSIDYTDDAVAAFSQLDTKLTNRGHMYEVNINADPESFLDWDKPLAEQPHAKAAVDQIFDPGWDDGSWTPLGSDLVGQVDRQKRAEIMKAAGIPGIKYLDAGSRNAGDGSRNYVVFDDKLIDIVRKYGLLAALGGGFGAGLLSQPTQAQAQDQRSLLGGY